MFAGGVKNVLKRPYSLSGRLLSRAAQVVNSCSSERKTEPDKLYKKISIEVRGNDKAVLESYADFAVMAGEHLEVVVSRNSAPRKPVNERLTLLKSAHVHKKHRVQYEMRSYYRYIDFSKLTGSTADTLLEYLERNLPEGVGMKVTKTEAVRLPGTISEAEQ